MHRLPINSFFRAMAVGRHPLVRSAAAAEATLYRLLQHHLPNLTIASIGHRSTLAAFHERRLAFLREGELHVLSETNLTVAAE